MSPSTRSFPRLLAFVFALSCSVFAQGPSSPAATTSAGSSSTSAATPAAATTPAPVAPVAADTWPATPLMSKHFTYSNMPYQADDNPTGARGPQYGYNLCNSTTQNQQSKCQTLIMNDIEDFCLYSAPEPNSLISDTEGIVVAWCTKPRYGTRLIPKDTLQGVQFLRTPGYVQVAGFIDQTKLNLVSNDTGGELDGGAQDGRGNCIGAVVFSDAFGPDNKTFTHCPFWHLFIGSGFFCQKACDPTHPDAASLCEHIYDRMGCEYNCPTKFNNGTFESCQGDNQDPPGQYTVNGQVMKYTQPAEGQSVVAPYTARIPPSSNCVTYTSSALYTDILAVTAPGASASASASGKAGSSASGSGAKASSTSNDATPVALGSLATLLGAAFAALFLA